MDKHIGSTRITQYAAVTDLLAHGEIYGLVGGLSGVYYNGTALAERPPEGDFSEPLSVVTFTGYQTNYNAAHTTKQFIHPNKEFENKKPFRRHVLIRKALSVTTSAAIAAGDDFIPFTDMDGTNAYAKALRFMLSNARRNNIVPLAWFTHDDGNFSVPIDGPPFPIAGNVSPGGIRTRRANIKRAIPQGATVYIDWAGLFSSINTDGQTITFIEFNRGSGIGNRLLQFTQSNPATIIAFPEQEGDPEVVETKKTFRDTFVSLRRGTRYQKGGGINFGSSPTSSFMIGGSAVGGDLHMYNGIGNAASHQLPENAGSITTAAATLISAGAFNFGQYTKEEVDSLDVDIEFPGGLYGTRASGSHYNVFVEHQIVFEYKGKFPSGKPADTEYKKALVVGKSYGGDDFVNRLTYINGDLQFNTAIKPSERFAPLMGPGKREGTGMTLANAQVAPFIETHTIDLTPFKPFSDWRISVRRLVPGPSREWWSLATNESAQASSRIKTVTAHIREKLSYPLTAFATVGFSAQDFPTPPERAYHLKGRRLRIPTNYFPRDELRSTEALYTRNVTTGAKETSYQTWDGNFRGNTSLDTSHVNFRRFYCNNPAWIFYDILLDKDYGLGEFIEEEDIDKYALYQIARYCDEMVPDGKGGFEPRFTCNVYLQKQVEAYKVLKDLSSTFRSMMYWIDGKITSVQDRPKEPVYTFTTGNVKDGVFDYTYTGSKARINQVRASWNDPEDFYRNTIVSVDDLPDMLKQGRTISKDVVAFGCTSQGQARRVAQWHLDTDVRETEIVTFTSSLNAGFLRPGDIINVQDKRVGGIIASGRVTSASGSTSQSIKLDRTVTFPGGVAGTSCNLYLLYPNPGVYLQQESGTFNGQSYKRGELLQAYRTTGNDASTAVSLLTGATQEIASKVKDDSGNAATVSFSPHSRVEVEAITHTGTSADVITTEGLFAGGAPAADAIWAISREDNITHTEVKKYRILGIAEESINEYVITASQYVPEKFDEIESEARVVTDKFIDRSIRGEEVPTPESLLVSLILSSDTGSYDAIIAWPTPTHSVTDTNGSSFTRPYPHIRGFEVTHDINSNSTGGDSSANSNDSGSETVEVPPGQRSLRLLGVTPGTYKISLRTINDVGDPSPPILRTITLLAQGKGILGRKETLPEIKNFEGTVSHNAGVITISNGTITTETETFSGVTGGSFNFTSMPVSSKAFLYFDASAAAYKQILVHEDTTSLNNFAYLKEITAANNGLIKCNGTVSLARNKNDAPGTGTSFTNDFSAGDIVKFSTNINAGTQIPNSEYRIVVNNPVNETLILDSVLFDRTSDNSGILDGDSEQYVFKQAFKPDFEKDAIVATLNKDSSGNITIEAKSYIPTNANATRNENKGVWSSSSTVYNVGDIVAFNGSSYTATSDHTSDGDNDPQDNSAPWSLLSSKGDAGAAGAAAKVAILESTDYSIVYNQAGSAPSFTSPDGNSSVIRLTATAQGYDTPEFKFLKDGTLIGGADWSATNTTVDITPGASFEEADTKDIIKVQVRENSSDSSPVEDSVAIIKIKQGATGDAGADAYTVALTNDSHAMPANSNGVVTSHDGSGTSIFVYKGGTLLNSIKGSGDPGSGQFKVTSIVATNITRGSTVESIDITDDQAVVGDHTNMSTSESTAKVEYVINAENVQSITKLQTFTKAAQGNPGTAAKTVHLTAEDYSIIYDKNGATPQPNGNMTLTATSSNFTDPYFKFTGDGITNEGSYTNGTSGDNSDTFTFSIPSSYFSTPKSLRVGVAEGNQTEVEVAFDTISINAVKPGADGDDAHTGFLTNASHTVASENDGTGYSLTNAGGTFERYKGATDLTGANTTYAITGGTNTGNPTKTQNGLTFTIVQATGVYTISGGSWTSDSETFTVTATSNSVTVSSTYNITKSKKGSTGATGVAGINTAVVSLYKKQTSSTGSGPDTFSGTFTYTFSTSALSGGTLNGWTTDFSDLELAAGEYAWVRQAVASATATATTDTIEIEEWSVARVHSGIGENGAPGGAGATGNTSVVVSLYQVSTSNSNPPQPPADNVGITYNFATGAISFEGNNNNGWLAEAPTVPKGSYLWVIQELYSANTATQEIDAEHWTDPVVASASGVDGDTGPAGLPAASYLVEYDDLEREVVGSLLADGKWWFMSTAQDAGGTSPFPLGNEWHELKTMTQFSVAKTDKASTNHSSYYSQVEVGDIITFRFTDTAWVSYRVTVLGGTTHYYNWQVTLVSYNESGIANAGLAVATQDDVNANNATAVGNYIIRDATSASPTIQVRFSRAPKGEGGIATLKLYRGSNAALDNSHRPSNVGVTFNTDGSTTNWVNVNGDNPWKTNLPGMLSAEGLLDIYEIETTVNREGTVSGIAQTAWSTPVLIRNRETWNITSVSPRPRHDYSGTSWSAIDGSYSSMPATVTATSSHNRKDTCVIRSRFSSSQNWASLSTGGWDVGFLSEDLQESGAETETEGFTVTVEPMVTVGKEKRKYVVVSHKSMKDYSGTDDPVDENCAVVEVEFKCRAIDNST